MCVSKKKKLKYYYIQKRLLQKLQVKSKIRVFTTHSYLPVLIFDFQ